MASKTETKTAMKHNNIATITGENDEKRGHQFIKMSIKLINNK